MAYLSTYLGVFLTVSLTSSLVSTKPCCSEDQPMVHNEENNNFICEDKSFIAIHQWCDHFYALDTSDPDEHFSENEDKSEHSTSDGKDWSEKYCTGTILNASEVEKNYRFNMSGVVAMVCFVDEVETHYSLYATCLLVSSVFLLITLIVYLLLPELRDLQGKCVMCSILSLMVGYLCLVYLQLPLTSPDYDEDNKCVIVAFMTYFWMLSAFFWLNINSFNMWRSSVLAHVNMNESKLMHYYYLGGWGIPLVFLTIALITQHLPGDNIIRPNFGVRSCWFQGKLELWSYFYGPVLILVICNILYFISMAITLWRDYRDPNPMPRIKSLRTKFCLYLKLFLVMGITWIFEIISSLDEDPWYVTDILNCLQGLIIFVVMILLRKRVWRLLAAKEVCGLRFPTCWQRMEDEESDRDMVDEQQLSCTEDKI